MKRTQEMAAYWDQEIRSYRESGLTQKAFCEANGHNIHKFKYWTGKLYPRRKVSGFVEAKVISSYEPRKDPELRRYGTLELSQGHRLVLESPELVTHLPVILNQLS